MTSKVSIIIPVYNEEKTIAQVIDQACSAQLPAGVSREIIIIDDGSRDQTVHILKSYENHAFIKIIRQENQGKTRAVLVGMEASQGDILLIQDADLEYNPSQYSILLMPLLEGKTDVVFGSRFLGSIHGMFIVNRLANMISTIMLRWLYGGNLTDLHTCFKVFKKESIRGIEIHSNNFTFDTEITVKILKKKIKILEVPIDYVARSVKDGKKINWIHALETFWPIIKYRFRD